MRVLWISNIVITDELKGSGSWIFGMAHALLSNPEISLGNIIPSKTRKTTTVNFKSIQQWKIPKISDVSRTYLTNEEKKNILNIVTEFKPDILHIWGIENGFALITPFVKCPVLVEIQGINSEIAKYYYGGLSFKKRLRLIGIKEVLLVNPPCRQKRKMEIMKKREAQIIAVNRYFTTPTDWMRANIEAGSGHPVCFSNGFILRDDFYETNEWKPNGNNILITSVSGLAPFKGIHILLDTLTILIKEFPNIRLWIIGPYKKNGIRTSGYLNYLINKIKKLGLEKNVIWLGSCSAKEICEHLHQSSVFVNSSFIESAGMTILEAMAVGIPIVSSYSGGIPSLASDSVLFYLPGDHKMCAFQIAKALKDKEIILNSGKLSRAHIKKYHNKELVTKRQLDIYKTIAGETLFLVQNNIS